jgi:hypothetical protein
MIGWLSPSGLGLVLGVILIVAGILRAMRSHGESNRRVDRREIERSAETGRWFGDVYSAAARFARAQNGNPAEARAALAELTAVLLADDQVRVGTITDPTAGRDHVADLKTILGRGPLDATFIAAFQERVGSGLLDRHGAEGDANRVLVGGLLLALTASSTRKAAVSAPDLAGVEVIGLESELSPEQLVAVILTAGLRPTVKLVSDSSSVVSSRFPALAARAGAALGVEVSIAQQTIVSNGVVDESALGREIGDPTLKSAVVVTPARWKFDGVRQILEAILSAMSIDGRQRLDDIRKAAEAVLTSA